MARKWATTATSPTPGTAATSTAVSATPSWCCSACSASHCFCPGCDTTPTMTELPNLSHPQRSDRHDQHRRRARRTQHQPQGRVPRTESDEGPPGGRQPGGDDHRAPPRLVPGSRTLEDRGSAAPRTAASATTKQRHSTRACPPGHDCVLSGVARIQSMVSTMSLVACQCSASLS